jgi:hypothetical protein
VTSVGDPLDQLPTEARRRLEAFSTSLERVHIDDLPLYAVRNRQPGHRRAVEAAALRAREVGLEGAIDGARGVLTEYLGRQYSAGAVRLGYLFEGSPGLGTTDDRVRVLRSLSDAVTALVLWDRLDDADRFELLGQWARLLP